MWLPQWDSPPHAPRPGSYAAARDMSLRLHLSCTVSDPRLPTPVCKPCVLCAADRRHFLWLEDEIHDAKALLAEQESGRWKSFTSINVLCGRLVGPLATSQFPHPSEVLCRDPSRGRRGHLTGTDEINSYTYEVDCLKI